MPYCLLRSIRIYSVHYVKHLPNFANLVTCVNLPESLCSTILAWSLPHCSGLYASHHQGVFPKRRTQRSFCYFSLSFSLRRSFRVKLGFLSVTAFRSGDLRRQEDVKKTASITPRADLTPEVSHSDRLQTDRKDPICTSKTSAADTFIAETKRETTEETIRGICGFCDILFSRFCSLFIFLPSREVDVCAR